MVALLAATVWVITACGGGSSNRAPDSQLVPDGAQLAGAPCSDCQPNVLSGVAATGGALADAEIRVFDSQGRSAVGRTNAQGRYDIAVPELRGALLVQVTGLAGGLPTQLHSASRSAEVGTRTVNITPLTELIVAQALGGRPADLLREARVDFLRLDAVSLQQAESAVEAVVRPVLNAVGVPAPVDLRVTSFRPDRTGLDRVLDMLVLAMSPDGYRLRHIATASADAIPLQPGAIGGAPPLPNLPGAVAQAGVLALAEVESRLTDFTLLFAQGLPSAASVRPWLSDGFFDAGLGADAFIAQVMQRNDPADQGGFSLRGARWHDARLLELTDANTARIRVRISLPAPQLPQFEEMWWIRTAQGWLLRGDGAAARVRVRHLAVLGPKPIGASALGQMTGARCPADLFFLTMTTIEQRCHIDGGSGDLPLAGVLDLGLPGDPEFGQLALYRSLQGDPEDRLTDHLLHSRVLSAPSQQIERHLLFEIDARRVDARAVRAQVFGPGLPLAGLTLVPPARNAGAPVSSHWSLTSDAADASPADRDGGGDDWSGVPLGWCDAAAGGAEAAECARAWATLGAGTRYHIVLQDGAGQTLGQVEAELAEAPPSAASLAAQVPALFARFDVSAQPTLQPSLARLLSSSAATPSAGDTLALQLPWLPPTDPQQRMVDARVNWWRAGFPPLVGQEVVRRRQIASGGLLAVTASARPGFRTRWLVAQLWAQDPMGKLYVHFVAPNNPH